jgi:hypothetical protein
MKALFVNANEQFIERLQTEGLGKQLVTSSFLQALEWIKKADLPIAGIYLNPNDTTYSALQFISEVIKERPVTPIFILDEDGDLSPQNFSALAEKFKLQGSFKANTPLADLLQPLGTKLPAALSDLKTRNDRKSTHEGYRAIPIVDFIYSKSYPANAFVEDDKGGLRFFATEGSEVDLEYLSYLGKNSSWLYIEEATIESKLAAYRLVKGAYLDPAYLSPSWRTAETFYRAKKFLFKLQQGDTQAETAKETFSVLQDLFTLTAQVAQGSGEKTLIDQAKRCDRAISSVTLSVLLCKKMKYGTTSIVETLGMASLLQDISLYRTPYGDISDVSPETLSTVAKAYYLNHPTMSAEIIGRIGKIPDLTLQIIRQQHERSDRTGFPNRVGGAQLQPLAEILSIINSYLDAKGMSEDFYQHYSDRVSVPFMELSAHLKMLKPNR